MVFGATAPIEKEPTENTPESSMDFMMTSVLRMTGRYRVESVMVRGFRTMMTDCFSNSRPIWMEVDGLQTCFTHRVRSKRVRMYLAIEKALKRGIQMVSANKRGAFADNVRE